MQTNFMRSTVYVGRDVSLALLWVLRFVRLKSAVHFFLRFRVHACRAAYCCCVLYLGYGVLHWIVCDENVLVCSPVYSDDPRSK